MTREQFLNKIYTLLSGTKVPNYDKEVLPMEEKTVQPTQYSDEELDELRKFIEVIKNDETRSALACWGNHDDYTRGY